jgi:phage terminase large subunit-like protein
MMAAKNPQLWTFSNAGDQHSLILNQLRDRGQASAAGSDDDIAYFEWSAYSDKITDEKNWVASNPALGHTIHADNIRAVLNDPPDVVQTEVLCRWVNTISGAIPAKEWNECGGAEVQLDVEKVTWFGLDLSPDRRDGALVAAQKNADDTFNIKLLHTWHNPISLDDKAVANDIAPYARKYPLEYVAFSKRTSSAVAARLAPAGIPVIDIDGALYGQSCDELLGANYPSRYYRPSDYQWATAAGLSDGAPQALRSAQLWPARSQLILRHALKWRSTFSQPRCICRLYTLPHGSIFAHSYNTSA